jgi:hypothetical protein
MKTLSRRSSDDKLLTVIHRYNEAIAATYGLDDDDAVDAGVDRADRIIARAVGMPALTSESALAALDLVVDDNLPDGLIKPLLKAVRRYVASTAA